MRIKTVIKPHFTGKKTEIAISAAITDKICILPLNVYTLILL